jgi:hypothetical protein
MVGLGGIFVGILEDTSRRLPAEREVHMVEMLSELRAAKMLAGYRNASIVDPA